jgi:hypothetical protein
MYGYYSVFFFVVGGVAEKLKNNNCEDCKSEDCENHFEFSFSWFMPEVAHPS